jgi:hypothetical protein
MLNKFFNKIKIVYLSIQNKLPILLGKIFTQSNINKVIIIFIVGFISRIFIVKMYNVNVFFEYLNIISILYYSCMSFFVVIIHEFVNFFEFNIIPSYLLEFSSFLVNIFKYLFEVSYFIYKKISYGNKLIFSLNFSEFKLSSIIKDFRLYLNKEKITMDIDVYENKEHISKVKKTNDYVLQRNELKSSRGQSISSNKTENVRLPEYYPRPGIRTRTRGEDGHIFHLDGIRNSSVSVPERPFNSMPSSPIPTIPDAPNLNASKLSTPSISTINEDNSPRFPNLTDAVYSPNDIGYTVTNPQENNSTYNPVPYSTSVNNPVPYSTSVNRPEVSYSTTNNSYTSTYNSQDYDGNGPVYPIPAEVPYFDPARVSNETAHATIGLNRSNERLSYFEPHRPGSVN